VDQFFLLPILCNDDFVKKTEKISKINNIENVDHNFWGRGGSWVNEKLISGFSDPHKLCNDGFVKRRKIYVR